MKAILPVANVYVCVLYAAMASAMPGQQQPPAGPAAGYVSATGQYVGGPAQPQPPVIGGHPQQQPGPPPPPGHLQHQPGPNEASLAQLISFD